MSETTKSTSFAIRMAKALAPEGEVAPDRLEPFVESLVSQLCTQIAEFDESAALAAKFGVRPMPPDPLRTIIHPNLARLADTTDGDSAVYTLMLAHMLSNMSVNVLTFGAQILQTRHPVQGAATAVQISQFATEIATKFERFMATMITDASPLVDANGQPVLKS